MVKRWYFREFPDLRRKFKADRGHLLEAKIERIAGGSGISKREVEEALNRVGLVIYRKRGALEYPAMILFLSNVAKYSTIFNSNEAVTRLRNLYPNVIGGFASVIDEKAEKDLTPENFEHLEYIVLEHGEITVLEKLASVLQTYFEVDAKLPFSYWS